VRKVFNILKIVIFKGVNNNPLKILFCDCETDSHSAKKIEKDFVSFHHQARPGQSR
jgi:hypothetical protein